MVLAILATVLSFGLFAGGAVFGFAFGLIAGRRERGRPQ